MELDPIAETERLQPLRDVDIRWFIDRNVPPLALAKGGCGPLAFVARDQVGFDDGRFEFARYSHNRADVVPAYVVPVFDQHHEPLDLVAFRPGKVGSWLGRACLVGEEQVLLERVDDDALDIFENTLDWLRHGRTGCVILDPLRAAWVLHGAGPIRARNIEHGHKLSVALSVPPPKIVIRDATLWQPRNPPQLKLVSA